MIIVPAYNEEKSLKRVVESLRAICPQFDYVIVNDGSTDRTRQICEENGYNTIHLPENRGLTNAIQTGMRYAVEHDYEAAMQFDADGQHLAEYIEEMAACMARSGCDIVIGSRFKNRRIPLTMRTIGGRLIARAIYRATGQYLTDPTSGMRMYGKRIISLFAKNYEHAPEPDTIAYLIRMGAKVEEIEVTMEERQEGESYFTPWRAISYMCRVLSSILFLQRLQPEERLENSAETLSHRAETTGGEKP